MQSQLRLRQVMQHVDSLKRLQTETAAELDAMLPSITMSIRKTHEKQVTGTPKGEVLLYQPDDVSVRLEDETVWLSKCSIALKEARELAGPSLRSG